MERSSAADCGRWGSCGHAERQAAAEQYVAEALADEAGLKVDSVALAESGGTAKLTVCVSCERHADDSGSRRCNRGVKT